MVQQLQVGKWWIKTKERGEMEALIYKNLSRE